MINSEIKTAYLPYFLAKKYKKLMFLKDMTNKDREFQQKVSRF